MDHHALWYKFRADKSNTRSKALSLVLYPMVTRTIRILPSMSWSICIIETSNLISVTNIKAKRTLPASCKRFLGLLSPNVGTPANRDLPSTLDSARTNRSAPIKARFLNRNWRSQRMLYANVWRTTMKNKTPQAMLTRHLAMTITHPPSWPIRLIKTNTVAKNCPQFQDKFMYSLCSLHWNHILNPSSRKVAIRHSLANVGRMCFPLRITWKIKR